MTGDEVRLRSLGRIRRKDIALRTQPFSLDRVKQAIKHHLAWLLRLYRSLFAYPRLFLEQPDYDAYWRQKRGKNLGICNPYQQARAEWIVQNVEAGASVLDLGCGDGAVLLHMLRFKRLEVTGADVSSHALDFLARQGVTTIKAQFEDPHVLQSMPEVDHILMLEVLEHIQNSENLLKAAIRKARRSVFVSFPNTGYYVYRLRLLLGRFPVQWRVHPGEHLRYWTLRDLKWWLNELGHGAKARIHVYEGVPVLNRVFPGLFGAAFIFELKV
jgi:methionine biosynthesis protein MetW